MGNTQARATRILLAVTLVLAAAGGAWAQDADMADDMVGQSEQAWRTWKLATAAMEREKVEDATAQLETLAAMDLSPLRLALMADRTGTLRFEQLNDAGTLGATGQALAEKIATGRNQKKLAEDGWHFAAIGRFEIADANFKALVDAGPDPVALLELARYNPNRHQILIKLMSNTDIGPSARAFMDLLQQGEERLRQDPQEITVNIERLAGTARMVFNATNNLKSSGEYAVPHLLRYLQDPAKAALKAPILKLMPQLGREAVNPLVISLNMSDQVVKQIIIDALAEIGYRQALPYLARLADGHDKAAPAEVAASAKAAMRRIDAAVSGSASHLFLDLAEAYHADLDSVRADARLTKANVWYWTDGRLVYVPAPREIFNDIMAMRCCESALELESGHAPAAALWLASNFRREAKLSMNVESEEVDVRAANDATKPENYPRSIYFARAAGALHNHLVLGRAVRDRDPGVALGAIAALAVTAGEPSLLGVEDAKQALAESLTFPHRLVRIKAALAIGRAQPRSEFPSAHKVVPVLSEALTLSTRKLVLVVDPADQSRNKTQAVLRAAGMDAVAGGDLYATLQAARDQGVSHFDVILLAADIASPDLLKAAGELRADFMTAATPIVVYSKPGTTALSQRAARSYSGVSVLIGEAVEGGTPEEATTAVVEAYRRAAATLGIMDLTEELALSLSLEAADVVRLLAVSRSTVLDYSAAEGALITALGARAEVLRVRAAAALALINSSSAQEAIAEAAVNEQNSQSMRVSAFASLAESARTHGSKLGPATIDRVVALTLDGKDLVIRTAASQALGALNLESNRASEIIRAQSRG